MAENRTPLSEEPAVDRREEQVVTQQPGYASTTRVERDYAAEQRMGVNKVASVIWILLSLVEILLGLRFILKLIGANAGAGFAQFIYGATGWLVAPFEALIGTPSAGAAVLEVTTLIAMLVYLLFVWLIVRLIMVAANRTTRRVETHSERRDDQM